MPHTMKLRPRTPARRGSQYAGKFRQRAAVGTSKWSRRVIITTGIVLLFLLLRATFNYINSDSSTTSDGEEEDSYYTGRKLQSTNTNSSHKGVAWETCEFEKDNHKYVFLIPYLFLIFSLFIGVAIICDDFFVPSLEAISEKLDLSEDVAGATFMAAGSSAPELFTSVAGVGVESDVGIGTIVGSAMFNILIIIALSAVLSGQVLSLDWRPLARDSIVYGLSIVVFIGFAWDGKLEWYEALLLLLIYVSYIAIMKFNAHLLRLLAKIECNWCRNESRIEPMTSTVSGSATATTVEGATATTVEGGEHKTSDDGRTGSRAHTHVSHDGHEEHRHRFVHSHRGELAGPIANRRRSSVAHHHSASHAHHHSHLPHTTLSPIPSQPSDTQPTVAATGSQTSHHSAATHTEEEEEEEEAMVLLPCLPAIRTSLPNLTEALEQGKLGIVKYILHWFLFVMAFPYLVAYTWTIPNCSKNRKWYVVTAAFLMAILWIAVISFGMVTLVARVGCILDVGEFTMGLVVVAVGTSIPDAISSILVARDGFGDMAVSNAIGSNVFDINLGLGLPFLIRTIVDKGKAFSLLNEELQERYDSGDLAVVPHAKFGFLLLFVLLATVATLTAFRFRLNSFTGLCFVIIYALFLTYSFVQETICERGQYC